MHHVPRTRAALAAAAAGASLIAWEQAVPARWRRTASTLDDLVAGWGGHRRIPGVMLRVTRDGEVSFEGASGRTRRWGGTPLRPSDRFHTASVGKLFTAVTILRLWEQQRLDLDLPIAAFIDRDLARGTVVINGVDYADGITVRRLLNHTAGLGNSDDDLRFQLAIVTRPYQRRTPQLLLDRARRIPAVGVPGQVQSYASPGYFLLGLVIEAATGRSYHEAVRQEVLTPVGLNDTGESIHEWVRSTREQHHYVGLVDLWKVDPSFEFADGGYVTTLADLTRFGAALSDGSIFASASTMEEMLRPPVTTVPVDTADYIGLGVHVARDPGGHQRLYHLGFWGTGLVVVPDEQLVAAYSLGQALADAETFESVMLDLATQGLRVNSEKEQPRDR